VTDLPRVKLARVDKLTGLFVSLLPRGGTLFTMQDVQRLVNRVDGGSIKALANLSATHVRTTLCQYVGRQMTSRLVNLIARQMAGRFDDLHIMPLPSFQEVRPGWAAFEVVDAKPVPWRETDYGHAFTLYALTGPMSGVTFDKKFPDSWLRGLAYRLGYSRRNIYEDNARDMIGFRFWANVALSDRDPRIPEITDVVADRQVLKHNKEIVKRRTRLEKELDVDLCPNAFEHPCSECPCSDAECPAAYARTIHGPGTVQHSQATASV
jgi:hypothetical protein